jgi:DNA-binding helix-hairpin-helix protein with protein kinase domain
MGNGRRLLYTAERVHALIDQMRRTVIDQMRAEMRGELQAMAARHRAEVDAVRQQLDDLRAATLARSNAELELQELRRLREIGKAKMTQRDIDRPLH